MNTTHRISPVLSAKNKNSVIFSVFLRALSTGKQANRKQTHKQYLKLVVPGKWENRIIGQINAIKLMWRNGQTENKVGKSLRRHHLFYHRPNV